MKRVRQKRTKPEEIVAAALTTMGIRYRRNVRSLPGSPDFANKKRKWAIFVMGCFWHHHTNCKRATIPTRNRDFWTTKFSDNRRRDARKLRLLRRVGYRVQLIWECQTAQVVPLSWIGPIGESILSNKGGSSARSSIRSDEYHLQREQVAD